MEFEKRNYDRLITAMAILFATWAMGWAGYYLVHLKTAFPLGKVNFSDHPLLLIAFFAAVPCMVLLVAVVNIARRKWPFNLCFEKVSSTFCSVSGFFKRNTGQAVVILPTAAIALALPGGYWVWRKYLEAVPLWGASVIAIFVVFAILAVVIARYKPNRLFAVAALFSTTIVFLILAFIRYREALLSSLLTCAMTLLCMFGGLWALKKLTGKTLPLYAGGVFAFILLALLFIPLGYFELATQPVRIFSALLLGLLGCIGIYQLGPEYIRSKLRVYRSADVYGWLWIFAILLPIMGTYSLVFMPDIYSDSVRVSVPDIHAFVYNNGYLVRDYSPVDHIYPTFNAVMSLPYALGGYIGLKTVTWVIGMLLIAAIVDTVLSYGMSRAYALATAFVIISMPVFFWHYGGAVYKDMPVTAFCLAAFALALRYAKESSAPTRPNNILLLFTGMAMGAAMVIKMNGIPFAAGLLFCVFCGMLSKGLLRRLPWLVLGVAIASLPHFIITWKWTGNPFYPIFNSYFESKFVTWSAEHGGLPAFTFRQYMVLPFSFTFNSFRTIDENYNGSIGPFFMMFFPFLFIGLFKGKTSWWPLFISIFLFSIQQLVSSCHLRHLFPVLPLVAIAGAQGIWRVKERLLQVQPVPRPVIWSSIVFMAVLTFSSNAIFGCINPFIFKERTDTMWATKNYRLYSGLDKYLIFLKFLPAEARIAVSGLTFVAHLNSSGKNCARELASTYFLFRYGKEWYDPELISRDLEHDYDLWLVNSTYVFEPFSKTGYQTAERLIYADNDYYTFIINDGMVPNLGISRLSPAEMNSSGVWTIPTHTDWRFVSLVIRAESPENLLVTVDFADDSGILSSEYKPMIKNPFEYPDGYFSHVAILYLPVPAGTINTTIKLEGDNMRGISAEACFTPHSYSKTAESWKSVGREGFPLSLSESEWYRFPSNKQIPRDLLDSPVVLPKISMPVPSSGELENSTWFRFAGKEPVSVEADEGLVTDYEHWLGHEFRPAEGGKQLAANLRLVSTGPETAVNIDFQRFDSSGKVVKVYRQPLKVKGGEAADYTAHCVVDSLVGKAEKWNLVVWPQAGQPAAILSSCELSVAGNTSGWLAIERDHWCSSRLFEVKPSADRLQVNLRFFSEGQEDIYIDLHKVDVSTGKSVWSQRKTIYCTSGLRDYLVEYIDVFQNDPAGDYEYKLLVWPSSAEIDLWLSKCSIAMDEYL